MTPHARKTPTRREIVSGIMEIDTQQSIGLRRSLSKYAIIPNTQIVPEPDDDRFHVYARVATLPSRRQRSEQYFTLSQFLAQDFRHDIGRRHAAQGFVGNDCLLPRNPSRAEVIVAAQRPIIAQPATDEDDRRACRRPEALRPRDPSQRLRSPPRHARARLHSA